MDRHVRNVGFILLYMGIAFGAIALIVLGVSGGFSGLLLTNDPFYKRTDLASIPLGRLLAAVYVIFSLALAGPLAIAGMGILRWKPWAKTMGMLLSAFTLLHFPAGTGVGIYALWVLTDETTEFLFAHPPATSPGGRRAGR